MLLYRRVRLDENVRRDMEIKIISSSDIATCPHLILSPEHYRDDGTCRCTPEDMAAKRVRLHELATRPLVPYVTE